MCLLEGWAYEQLCCVGTLTLGASRDTVMGYHVCYTVSSCTFVHFNGCLFPITFPVTVGLGGSMEDALNALASVLATGGGRRFCARDPSIRLRHFPYSTVVVRRAFVHSQDLAPVSEAAVDIELWRLQV